MNAEKNFVLSILRQLVTGTGPFVSLPETKHTPIDWGKIKILITEQGVAPLIYPFLKDLDIPEEIKEYLKSNYYLSTVRGMAAQYEFMRITSLFKQNHVALAPIKGTAFLLDIYAQLPARPMADMDFLAKEEELPRAQNILEACGYKKDLEGLREEYWRNDQCHFVFHKDTAGEQKNMHIDLHWALDFKRKKRSMLPELWKRARITTINGQEITLLSPEDNLFSLVLHQRRFGKIVNLKYALDTALILHKYPAFDWDYVLQESLQGKMCSPLFFLLAQTEYFLGVNIPRRVLQKLGVPAFKQKIIRSFIAKNAFAHPDRENLKKTYLGSHFLLYDSFLEPVEYIIKIPREQFAKFYGLKPYAKQTGFLYNNRLWYMPLRFLQEKLG